MQRIPNRHRFGSASKIPPYQAQPHHAGVDKRWRLLALAARTPFILHQRPKSPQLLAHLIPVVRFF